MPKLSLKQILLCLAATLMIGIGVAAFLSCGLGSDALTVFMDGMNRTFSIRVSLVNQAIALIILTAAWFLNRGAVGITTVLNVLLTGVCIEAGYRIIGPFQISTQPLWIRLVCMAAAQIILSSGYGLLQVLDSGMGYSDALLYGIASITGRKYFLLKTIYEACFMITGFLLKGVVGVGTVFSILTIGPLNTAMKRVYEKILA